MTQYYNSTRPAPRRKRRSAAGTVMLRSAHYPGSGRALRRDTYRTSAPRGPSRLLALGSVFLIGAAVAGALFWWYWQRPFLEEPVLAFELPTAAPARAAVPAPGNLQERRVEHTIGKGETLVSILDNYGLDTAEANRVREAREAVPGRKKKTPIRAGDKMELIFDAAGQPAEIRSTMPEAMTLVLTRLPDGTYERTVHQPKKMQQEQVAVGTIQSSFAAAAAKAGIQYDTVDELVDLFSNRVSFHRDLRKGDRFTLIFQGRRLEDGTPISPGPILAAALQIGGDQLSAVRYVGSDGKARYFDERGELIGNTFLRYPLKFSRISSYFSTARFHPVLKRRRPHNGVDFAAPTGTPVRTVADGHVEFAGRKGGNGIMVKIRHTDRYSTAYAHLSRIAGGIRRGGRVKRGEVIGAVGMTGLATGPHLHYAFYDQGRYVDPLKIKLPTVESLDQGTKINHPYLDRVLYTLRHYQTVPLEGYYLERGRG